jgi:hypothetical protein
VARSRIRKGKRGNRANKPDGEAQRHHVDVKSAPYAKHTASRTSWLHTRKDSKTCQSIFLKN